MQLVQLLFLSAALRHDLRKRDDHLPADVLSDREISRDSQQRARVHEAPRRAQVSERASHGLRRLDLGHNEGHRYS